MDVFSHISAYFPLYPHFRGSAHFGQNENEESSADISTPASECHSEKDDKPADDSGSHSEEARRRSSVNVPVADSGRHSEDTRGRSSINIPVDDNGRYREEARGRRSVNVKAADSGRHGEVARGRSDLNFSSAGSKRLKEETLVKSPTTKKRRSRSPEVVVLGDTDDWPGMVHDACGTTRDNCAVVSEVRFFFCVRSFRLRFSLGFSFCLFTTCCITYNCKNAKIAEVVYSCSEFYYLLT